jgi:CRISPR system Cascade subunit CasC
MRLIELHILQSFPVSCLNRDEVGTPKTCWFAGVQRARISSQCLKRATREFAQGCEKDETLKLFAGVRTRRSDEQLADVLARLRAKKPDEKPTEEEKRIAHLVCEGFLSKGALKSNDEAKTRKPKSGENASATAKPEDETSTLLYFSPGELDLIGQAIHESESKETPALHKKAVDALKKAPGEKKPKDLADIAVFGRMVSNAADLTLEGAGMFSHALTTHAAKIEQDFWTAVEDRKKPGEHAGGANMGVAEFTSGVFYRYVGLNLDLLFDGDHLGHIVEPELRRRLIRVFLRASLQAVPSARANSHNSHTETGYVVGLVRETGHPLQLVNAFEDPVRPSHGLLAPSVRNLLLQLQRVKKTYVWEKEDKTKEEWFKADLERATGVFRVEADKEIGNDGEKLASVPEWVTLPDFCYQLAEKAVPTSTQA